MILLPPLLFYISKYYPGNRANLRNSHYLSDVTTESNQSQYLPRIVYVQFYVVLQRSILHARSFLSLFSQPFAQNNNGRVAFRGSEEWPAQPIERQRETLTHHDTIITNESNNDVVDRSSEIVAHNVIL